MSEIDIKDKLRGEALEVGLMRGGIPLTEDSVMRDRSLQNAHVAVHSTQEFKARVERGETPGAMKPPDENKLLRRFAATERYAHLDMEEKWSERQEGWVDTPEKKALETLQVPQALEETLTWRYPPSKFILFGFPSMELKRFQHQSYRQHYLAYRIVMHMINRLFDTYIGAVQLCKPEIIIDPAHMTGLDRMFLRDKYGTGAGGWGVRYCSVLAICDAPSLDGCFGISFLPQNPIRQILAERALIRKLFIPAMICAPPTYDFDNLDMDGAFFCGDRFGESVEDWLSNYVSFEFNDSSEITTDENGKFVVDVFGETRLYLHKEVVQEFLATGNTPQAEQASSPQQAKESPPSSLALPESATELKPSPSRATQSTFRHEPKPLGPLAIPDAADSLF